MVADPERRLAEYVAAVAAGTATPGGGSVAAVVGALAAALGEMVTNLTPGRDKGYGAATELRAARDQLTALRETLLAAAAADEAAYEGYRQASALPRASEAEQATRSAAVQEALIVATEEPLRVAQAAMEVARLMETVAAGGNPHLRTDAALGALLAEAALRGALLNVRGNAPRLRDHGRATRYLTEAGAIETEGRAAAGRAYGSAQGGDVSARR